MRWEKWGEGRNETWWRYGDEGSEQGEVQYLRGWEEGEVREERRSMFVVTSVLIERVRYLFG